MSKILIALDQNSGKSRVWLDDVDITGHVRGFVLTSEVGSLSEIELTLSMPAEIEGDVGRVLTAYPRREGAGILQEGSTPERMRG